jgi:hypothetical protein
LSNTASVKGAPFGVLALEALVLAFAAAAGFVAVFTVISFFPRFEALLPHSAKVLQPFNQYFSIFFNNDRGGGLYLNLTAPNIPQGLPTGYLWVNQYQ